MRSIKFLICASLILAACGFALGQGNIRLEPFLTGLNSPLYLTNAKDGTRRIFVVQQGGIIKVVQPGSSATSDFLNITAKVLSGGERGLLGLAFHPQFASNGYFFVNYTRQTDGATVIARYRAINNNSQGDPNSELVLLTIAQPFSNHNGGMIEFGPDGNLYIGMGDGGSGNDPQNNAQNINSLLGKMLRITPSVAANPAASYTIPSDNPYVGVNGADEIFAIGLRNPFRWSFDSGGLRQLWAGDVGQNAIEEVDIITKGGNYGWRVYEGTQCNTAIPNNCPTTMPQTPPIFEYSHAGGRCSVTGGYVYRGTRGTLPNGAYIYGDYCSGEIWIWQNNQQILLLDTTRNIASFGEDEVGEIYVVGLGGTVDKLIGDITEAGIEADVAPRPNGGGSVNPGDVTQIQRFAVGLDQPFQSNEFQRADCAPRMAQDGTTLLLGNGAINTGDVTQAQRYAVGLDGAPPPAGGPTSAGSAKPPLFYEADKTGNDFLFERDSLFSSETTEAVQATYEVRAVRESLTATTLTVAIQLDTDVSASTLAASVGGTLRFDQLKLSNPTNIRLGSGAPAGTSFFANTSDTANGRLGFTINAPVNQTFALGEQQLLLIDFTVIGTGSTILSFDSSQAQRFVGDVQGNELSNSEFPPTSISLSPTAATVSVSGRVMWSGKGAGLLDRGRNTGIARARVSFIDITGQQRTAFTNQFGYFRFDNVEAGLTYVFEVQTKGREFSPQVVTVNETIENLNFVSVP